MRLAIACLLTLMYATSAARASIDDIAWLAGCWAADEKSASLRLYAQPSGKPAVPFDLFVLNDALVAFQNPNHDFPQRITYELVDDSKLLGTIDGLIGERQVSVRFPMTRTTC